MHTRIALTVLSIAVKAGSSPVVAMLVESGADINAPNYNEETPLTIATSRGLGSQPLRVIVRVGVTLITRFGA